MYEDGWNIMALFSVSNCTTNVVKKNLEQKPGHMDTICPSMTYWHRVPGGVDEQKPLWWVVICYSDVTAANNCRNCRRKK